MPENDDPTPADPAPAEQTAVHDEAAAPAAAAQPKLTDRLWNFRAMAAVALAALLLGGGIGAAITAASQDDGPERRGFLRIGDGPRGPGDFHGPGMPGMDPQQRQQFREHLKDMRKDLREWRKDRLEEDGVIPQPPTSTPTPAPTPNG